MSLCGVFLFGTSPELMITNGSRVQQKCSARFLLGKFGETGKEILGGKMFTIDINFKTE